MYPVTKSPIGVLILFYLPSVSYEKKEFGKRCPRLSIKETGIPTNVKSRGAQPFKPKSN
jgi:hypothetical protein